MVEAVETSFPCLLFRGNRVFVHIGGGFDADLSDLSAFPRGSDSTEPAILLPLHFAVSVYLRILGRALTRWIALICHSMVT